MQRGWIEDLAVESSSSYLGTRQAQEGCMSKSFLFSGSARDTTVLAGQGESFTVSLVMCLAPWRQDVPVLSKVEVHKRLWHVGSSLTFVVQSAASYAVILGMCLPQKTRSRQFPA